MIASAALAVLHANVHFPAGKLTIRVFTLQKPWRSSTFRARDAGALEFVAFGALRLGRGSLRFVLFFYTCGFAWRVFNIILLDF